VREGGVELFASPSRAGSQIAVLARKHWGFGGLVDG